MPTFVAHKRFPCAVARCLHNCLLEKYKMTPNSNVSVADLWGVRSNPLNQNSQRQKLAKILDKYSQS